jgi:hypothetical protein
MLHGDTLQATKYFLRTQLGISATSYSHTPKSPIYGTGQGSGNSPALWLLLSATLFDVHRENANGAIFQDPLGTTSVKMSICGFVDDTNACINEWLPQRDGQIGSVLDKVRQDEQLWNDLLFITGGQLELSKCSYHLLSFNFKPDGTPVIRNDKVNPIPIVDSITGMSVQMKHLSSHKPHKTLGHWMAPAGTSRTQLTAITSKSQVLSTRIATSHLSRYGAQLAYRAIYVATLRYVLPQCHFTHKVLRKAERKSMSSVIAKCGFSQKTPFALLFAPIEYGGGGFLHWDVLQSEGQILMFVKHWRTQTDISSTLRISIARCQWQAGTACSILSDTSPLDYLEARWIQSLREGFRACPGRFLLTTLRSHGTSV